MTIVKKLWKNGGALLARRQSGILSAAFVIAVTYGVSMLLGIARERLLVAKFYACCRGELDVYYAAFRLPDLIFQLVVIGALSAAFIPIFSETLTKDVDRANKLASSLINLLLAVFLLLALVIFLLAKPFSALITGNFFPWQIELMAQMTRLMLLAQAFFLISNFFSAIIQSHQRFLLPALSPVAYNLGIILMVAVFSPFLGIWSATFGVLLGAFFHLLIQLPLIIHFGFNYSFSFNLNYPELKRVLRLMFPRTLTLAASQIEATISLFLATSLTAGSLTIYYLAQRLVDLPVRLLGTSVGQAALPALSLQLAQKQRENFRRIIKESFNQVVYLSLPATAIFLVLRIQLVRFAYGAKTFPWAATILTGKTVAAVAFSIFSQCLIQLLVRGFYALHDTKTPFVVSVISMIINIGLSLYFIFGLGLGIFGLAVAFSIANFVNLLSLFLLFNFKKENFVETRDLKNWLKMLLGALAAGSLSWAAMKFLDVFVFQTDKTLQLLFLTLIAGGLGVGFYLLLSWVFGLDELRTILKLGRKLGQWRKTLFAVEEITEHPSTGAAS